MVKYTPLTEFLNRQTADSVELTFAEIERIINTQLSDSIRSRFWSWNNEPPGSVAIKAIRNAGFQVVMVDMENEKVKFQRM